jgi:hypothetical protein
VPPATAPPAAEAPPVDDNPGMTKAEAWAQVCDVWATKDAGERDAAWVREVKRCGKPEAELTPQDWARVAEVLSLPF